MMPGQDSGARASAMKKLASLFAVVPVNVAAKRELCSLMMQADRRYHGVDHLALLWKRHCRFAAEAGLDQPEVNCLVGSAIAYHDAIYDSGRRDNETRSAELWCIASAGAAITDADRSWVADTIRATADHLGYATDIEVADDSVPLEERARLWMLDLDLTPFGERPDEFDANTERLRAENLDTPTVAYETARLGLLRRFDASPRIYRSPVLASAFEAAARRNLARELAAA